MNIDRTLNIYQAYSLAKISALNKKLVIAQYAQSEQINKLEKSLSKDLTAISAANQKILENQLQEFKRQEKIRYYRNLAHNVKECIDVINEQQDLLLKSFLLEIFLNPLSFYLQDAKSNLEEIGDKEFCSNWEKVLQDNVNKVSAVRTRFNVSEFNNLLKQHELYKEEEEALEKQIFNKKKERLNINTPILETAESLNSYKSSGCLTTMMIVFALSFLIFILGLIGGGHSDTSALIPSVLIFVIIPLAVLMCLINKSRKKAKSYPTYLDNINKENDARLQNYNDSISTAELELKNLEAAKQQLENNHPYSKAKAQVSIIIPEWESIVEKIASKLPVDQSESAKTEYDSLLVEIAIEVVKHNTVSVSSLQRKYRLGYVRATKIVEQLISLGIVEHDSSSYRLNVVVVNDKALQLILEHYNIV